MPVFNKVGDYLANRWRGNVPRIVVQIVGEAFPREVFPEQSGGGVWIDDNRVVAQVCGHGGPQGCQLWCWDKRTGQTTVVDENHGASVLYGGGGEWLAGLDKYGMFSSTGIYKKDSSPAAVGPDAAIAYKVLTNSFGPFNVIPAQGKEWELTKGDAAAVQLFGGRDAQWEENKAIRTSGNVPVPLIIGSPFYGMKMIEIRGEWWCLYQSSIVKFHPAHSSMGYIITEEAAAFVRDVVLLPNGDVLIGWNPSAGDPIESVQFKTINLATPRVDLSVPPPVVVPPVQTLNRPTWTGFFVGSTNSIGGWQTNTDPRSVPGNCYLTIMGAGGPSLFTTKDGKVFARYVEGVPEGDIDAIERAIAAAPQDLPIIPEWPSSAQTRFPKGAAAVLIAAYCGVNESLAAFEERINKEVKKAPQVYLTPQCFSSNTTLTADLASIAPIMSRIARANPTVVGVIAFNGTGRKTGLQDHPELRVQYDQMFVGISPAPFPVKPTPPKPPDPKPPKPPEPPHMDKIPPISDDEIIELATVYDAGPPQPPKTDYAYLRDGAYYGMGYMRLRAMGYTHVDAKNLYQEASDKDAYYSVPISGMIPDDEVIEMQDRWTARYQDIGRYQKQSRFENVRDLTYWLIVYARNREVGRSHEASMREMERGMCAEAGLPDPYPFSPPSEVVRTGIVHGGGGSAWVDDQGEFFPVGNTLFWGLRGWKFERARMQANVVSFGPSHYVRNLCEVGWPGNDIQPDQWPDYDSLLAEMIDWQYDIAGKRTQLTMIGGGTNTNYERLAERIARIVLDRPHKVMFVEPANEWFQNFPDEERLKKIGKYFRSVLPQHLVVLSAPQEELATEKTKQWIQAGAANAGSAHFDRNDGGADWKWRHVRKPWESRGPGWPSSHNEPGGPRSSVAEYPEGIHLVMSRLVGIICGYRCYVLHNGAGVGGQVDTVHNRPANVFEVPGIEEVQRIVYNLPNLIPANTAAGIATRTGFTEHPMEADNFWPDGGDHGVVRDYANVRGDGFVQALLGIKNFVNMKSRGNYALTLVDPVTGDTEQRSVKNGELVHIESRSKDSRNYGALIVIGQRT